MDDHFSEYDESIADEDVVDEQSIVDEALPPEEADAGVLDDEIIDDEEEEIDTGAIESIKGLQKFELVSVQETYINKSTGLKQTKPFLTKYERAKILGVRAEMIASGDKPLVKVPAGISDAYQIALLEYKEKRIPLLIRRMNPDGSVEDWSLKDLVLC